MAYTAEDLTQIRACIASGVLSTRFADGSQVSYQNLDQLLAAEKVIAADVELATAPARGTVRRKYASFSNGC